MWCQCLVFFGVHCGREEILVKKPIKNPVSGSSHVSFGEEGVLAAKPTYYQYDLKFLAKIYFRTN